MSCDGPLSTVLGPASPAARLEFQLLAQAHRRPKLTPPRSQPPPRAMVSSAVVSAQLVFSYVDAGTQCKLHFSFAAHGAEPMVALRLRHPNGDGSWSGWHGSWMFQNCRGLDKMTAYVHWRGTRSSRLRRLVFHRVHAGLFLWYQGDRLVPVYATMMTDLPARKMLRDQVEPFSSWTLV